MEEIAIRKTPNSNPCCPDCNIDSGGKCKSMHEYLLKQEHQKVIEEVLYGKNKRDICFEWGLRQLEREVKKHKISCANICNIASNLKNRISKLKDQLKEE